MFLCSVTREKNRYCFVIFNSACFDTPNKAAPFWNFISISLFIQFSPEFRLINKNGYVLYFDINMRRTERFSFFSPKISRIVPFLMWDSESLVLYMRYTVLFFLFKQKNRSELIVESREFLLFSFSKKVFVPCHGETAKPFFFVCNLLLIYFPIKFKITISWNSVIKIRWWENNKPN